MPTSKNKITANLASSVIALKRSNVWRRDSAITGSIITQIYPVFEGKFLRARRFRQAAGEKPCFRLLACLHTDVGKIAMELFPAGAEPGFGKRNDGLGMLRLRIPVEP